MPGDDEHTTALEARKLTCVRGGRSLFSSLSFKVERGHALILRGPNGSGKTSLLRIIAGFLAPDEGHFCWGGVEGKAAVSALQENIHLIGHLTALKPILSVAENVALWAALHGGNGQTTEALHAMGLAELAELPVHFLSEGQKRRTALARLMAFQKPIWLLDEPLAGLDAASADRLMEAITGHLSNGGIAVIATHQLLQMDAALQSELRIGGRP